MTTALAGVVAFAKSGLALLLGLKLLESIAAVAAAAAANVAMSYMTGDLFYRICYALFLLLFFVPCLF